VSRKTTVTKSEKIRAGRSSNIELLPIVSASPEKLYVTAAKTPVPGRAAYTRVKVR
jgi:hypothetical protein